MKHYPKLLEVVAALLVVVLSTTGCMTRELWTERLYHPHTQPQVQLAASPERPLILVSYREQFEKTRHIRRRTFWLDLEDRYDAFSRPNFVDPAKYPGLIEIPLLDATQGTNFVPSLGYAAMETYSKPGFELWRDGQSLGRFALPIYEADAPVTAETVAKTPVVLLVDGGIIVLSVAAVVAILYLVANNNSN
jgi:hypothetical protein